MGVLRVSLGSGFFPVGNKVRVFFGLAEFYFEFEGKVGFGSVGDNEDDCAVGVAEGEGFCFVCKVAANSCGCHVREKFGREADGAGLDEATEMAYVVEGALEVEAASFFIS